ncbi:patatin-like phospholipase family protein [Sphingomonas sp. M1-B02]|uniref:patatin-like phospholipase family protein n=1 Tax=Sphingomonas sp. M1-B02 TaxID=3114300 RepID=UPI00223F33A5|nr:patatin-like phospholipase family protein [Sphingomonas sp. S6-11]UZK66418.1 patatin-like phospholipase family protein [Sphingomonas sp. S6-11]
MVKATPKIALVLGGGNALGSYQAGVYQALHEREREPDWVVGVSAGAINGALIAGNSRDDRIPRLTEFWQPGMAGSALPWWPFGDALRRSAAAMLTMGAGRPGVFGPVGPLGSWWNPDSAAAAPSLFDSKPLADTLARLVDFDRLNRAEPRFTAGSVDLETGEEVFFDTSQAALTPDHVRASASLLPTFPPVEVEGRAFVDGGLSANLPLDPVLGEVSKAPMLCIAVDLLPLDNRRPQTLGEGIARAQNLIFAAQTRRTIERWRMAYAHDPAYRVASATLVKLTYSDQEAEVAGKAMDFSPESVRQRWDAGYRDAIAALDRIASGEFEVGRPGLTVFEG